MTDNGPPDAVAPSPSPSPLRGAAAASWADPRTAAWNSSASPDAPAPPAALADPRAAQPQQRDGEGTRHTPRAPSHKSPPPPHDPYPQDSLHKQESSPPAPTTERLLVGIDHREASTAGARL